MSTIINTLLSALEASPQDWQCRAALVQSLVNENRVQEAHAVLAQVSELPADIENQLLTAEAFGFVDPARSIEVYDTILANSPQHAGLVFAGKARQLHAAGDLQNAVEHYNAAVGTDPTLADPDFEAVLGGNPQAAPAQAAPAQAAPPQFHPAPAAPTAMAQPAAAPITAPSTGPLAPSQPAVAPPAQVAAPPTGQLAPAAADRSDVYYPAPGEYPTMTLTQVESLLTPRQLVDPNSIPEAPPIVYQEQVANVPINHVDLAAFQAHLNNVAVQTYHYQEGVTYDYQAPDDTLFEPVVTADNIYVGAMTTEDGQAVASLQESIRRNKAAKENEMKKKAVAAKLQSIAIGLLSVVLVCFLLHRIVSALPRPNPPQLVASSVAIPTEVQEVETQVLQEQALAPTPTSSSALALDAVTVSASANIAMMSFDAPANDFGAMSIGGGFGSSMSFGPVAGGAEGVFLGTKTKGVSAVVFDISASMYGVVPFVVDEIKKSFREAQVVAVIGCKMQPTKDENRHKLISYEENGEVRERVENNGTPNLDVRDNMNRALFSLKNNLSIDDGLTNGLNIQNAGRAIELLLAQPLSKRPSTIFMFADFTDHANDDYLKGIAKLVNRKGCKLVLWHSTGKWTTRWESEMTYKEFAEQINDVEIKVGGLKK